MMCAYAPAAPACPARGGHASLEQVPHSSPSACLTACGLSPPLPLPLRSFTMTGGSKFGADMLAYPGDPSLYHAQFTVRLVPPGAAVNPMLLKATARGSHAARKHLLIASLAKVRADAREVTACAPVLPLYCPCTAWARPAWAAPLQRCVNCWAVGHGAVGGRSVAVDAHRHAAPRIRKPDGCCMRAGCGA